MVDMNMLLITFFMLCTTMIKSQTLQIVLPTNEDVKKEQQSQAKQSEAITLILDTEYTDDKPTVDAKPARPSIIYIIMKVSPTQRSQHRNYLRKEQFIGNMNHQPQGIRKILRSKNEEVMKEYGSPSRWKTRKSPRKNSDQLAKKECGRLAEDSSCSGDQTRSQHHLRGSHQRYRRNEHQPDFAL